MGGGSPTVYVAIHCTVAHIIMGGSPVDSVHSCTLHTWPSWGVLLRCTLVTGVLNGIMVSTGKVYIVQYCSNVHIAAFLLDCIKLLTSSNATVSGCPV